MATIIFDLDGTIANSFDFVADFLAKEARKAPLSAPDKEQLRGRSMAAMGRQLGISWLRLPSLFYRGRKAMRRSIAHVKPFAEMPEIIAKLHAEGHELFIVSSNSVHNVRKFLHHYQLHTYFLQIYGSIGLFSKAPTLRKLLKDHKFDVSQCVYIGDELRDVESARSINMRVIAVGWGFAQNDDLKARKPTKLVHTPAELFSVLEDL